MSMAIATTIGIVGSLLFEAIRFFGLVSPAEFFFGTEWSPQTALRADQVGSSGAFGRSICRYRPSVRVVVPAILVDVLDLIITTRDDEEILNRLE